MKILLFLIPSLVILFSCTKDKTPPKDECIEPYVGDYKVIELRKADGTIIPEDKVRDSLQADHAWIERRLIYQQSAPYGPERWIYEFKWSKKEKNSISASNRNITGCESKLNMSTNGLPEGYDSVNFPIRAEFLSGQVFLERNTSLYKVSNNYNSSQFKMIKQ